jgi:hypothetical protein
MRASKFLASLIAGASLIATPVLAQSANKLSVAQSARVGSPAEGSSELVGGSLIIALLAAAAVVAGIVVAADSDDSPASS